MDPNAALAAFLDACRARDQDAAREHLCDLNDWLRSGGFLPTDPRPVAAEPSQPETSPVIGKSGVALAEIAEVIAKRALFVSSAHAPGEPFTIDLDVLTEEVEDTLGLAEDAHHDDVIDASPLAEALVRQKHPQARCVVMDKRRDRHLLWIDC